MMINVNLKKIKKTMDIEKNICHQMSLCTYTYSLLPKLYNTRS